MAVVTKGVHADTASFAAAGFSAHPAEADGTFAAPTPNAIPTPTATATSIQSTVPAPGHIGT